MKVVSLFSGCGGMDLGFNWEGFRIVFATDIDPDACTTYYFNLGKKIPCVDIRNLNQSLIPDAEVLICGPPCQGFSNVGKRNLSDERNFLYLDVLRIVNAKKPSFVVIENVKGLKSFNGGAILEKLTYGLRGLGYMVEHSLLNARDFGIAQNRERLFIIANKHNIDNIFSRIENHKKTTSLSLKEIIGDLEAVLTLPNHCYNSNSNNKCKIIISKITQGQKLCNTRLGSRSVHTWQIPEVFGHTTNVEKNVLLAIGKHRRRKCYKKKESWNDASPLTINEIASIVGKEFNEEILMQLIKKNFVLEKKTGLYDLKHTFNGKYRRLAYNSISEAVLTNFGSVRNYVHPTQDRPFTVRECARIQGFPDNFIFKGSLQDQYQQVGNAVPPILAQVIAHEIKSILTKELLRGNKLIPKKFTPYVIKEIIKRLETQYRTPNLGNLSNPLNELIYLYISQRTFEKSYKSVFRKLKQKYPSFDKMMCADMDDVIKILEPSGLAKQKANTILDALAKINRDFGETSLRKLKTLNETSQLDYLLSLPRVGLKTAYCIMMFCFGSKLLPVDANIHRVCQRLGLLPDKIDSQKEHRILQAIIPAKDRYSFHVNCIMHARKYCIPLHPKCAVCCIKEFCSKD